MPYDGHAADIELGEEAGDDCMRLMLRRHIVTAARLAMPYHRRRRRYGRASPSGRSEEYAAEADVAVPFIRRESTA